MATARKAPRKTARQDKPKAPCENPTLCGVKPGAQHIIGSFTYRKCKEASRRIASGESVTEDMMSDLRPKGSSPYVGQTADKTKENIERLKSNADAWQESPEDALKFVRWSQQFHQYSGFNKLMVYLQDKDATQVAGRKKWEEMGRTVPEDAQEIAIFAPGSAPERIKKDENGNPVIGEDGKPVKEKIFVNKFRAVAVFDIASTEGDTPPEIESTVENPERLRNLIEDLETEYMVEPSGSVMAADTPARINSEGKVVWNSATQDEEQRMVNRLIAVGMAVSKHTRAEKYPKLENDKEKRWSTDDHLYAGVAAAWTFAKDAGVNIDDLAQETMANYKGKQRVSDLVSQSSMTADHISSVREGLPLVVADAML